VTLPPQQREGGRAVQARKRNSQTRPQHTDKARSALAYLGAIFCVACLSKSPSFPAIAKFWLFEEPACQVVGRSIGRKRVAVQEFR
jgi:hypothetical protein